MTETLTTVTEVEALLRDLAETHDWVSVFWDRGWGDDDNPAEISVIVDGHGDQPKAHLTKAVYAALVDSGVVGEDSYGGFKARRIHDFKTPPEPEKTGPSVNEVIEEVLRGLFAEHQDLPLKTAFFRGINKGNSWNPINEDELVTDAYRISKGYVNIHPGGGSPIVTAWDSKGMFGDKVGEASTVQAPTRNGEIDVDGMRQLAFREELLAAIRSQLAVLDEASARWPSSAPPDADLVRIACRALDISPVRAAMALGYLEPSDLDGAVQYEPMVQGALGAFEELSPDEQQQVLRFAAFLRTDSNGR